ncbi:MAG: protein kinase [Acidobacteriota bacterium]
MKVCPDCGMCVEDGESACPEPGHAAPLVVRPGERLVAGKYRLDRLIARGGMGAVFVAYHTDLERRVAVKLLRPDSVADPEARERFRREAKAVARINHPAVAALYDYGVLPGGEAYIVMELVVGETLRRALDREGPLSASQAAAIGRRIAQGMAAAHASGVIHRDLKPANIVLPAVPDGRRVAKIVDFSIAKLAEPGETLTGSGAFLGTPRYMSPEQCEGRELDARSDVYALGVLLYEVLSGRPPFEARTPAAIAVKQIRESPPPLLRVRPDVPEELARLVMKCLSKDPALRPQTAEEVGAALRRFEGPSVPGPVVLPEAAPGPSKPEPDRFATSPGIPRPPPEQIPASPDPVVDGGEPAVTGGSYWRSLPATERGGRSRPPRPALVDGAVAAALAAGALLLWLVVEVTPGRRLPPGAPNPAASTGFPATHVPETPAPTAAPSHGVLTTGVAAINTSRADPPASARRDDPRPALRDALHGWIAASNARDLPEHMRFYMPRIRRFYLRRDVSRDFVRSVKRELFAGADSISVAADDPEISTDRAGHEATMRFRKRYDIRGQRGERRGAVLQELVWVKTPEGWRIVGERDAKVLR